MKYCYLAGSIGGIFYNEAINWRSRILSTPIEGVKFISPMRDKEYLKHEKRIATDCNEYQDTLLSNPKAIFNRDSYDIRSCDFIFVNLPKVINDIRPSLGTVWEIGYAAALRKPIILVTDDPDYFNHPLLSLSSGWIVDTVDKGLDVVRSLVGPY